LNGKALALNFMGEPNEALIYLDKALGISPNNTEILTSKGLVLNSLARYSDALRIFNKILTIEPNNFYAFNLRMKLQEQNATLPMNRNK
jgi:tetratricopeptide (TPR) repeat protein